MHAINTLTCSKCVCLIQLGVRSPGKQHPLYQLTWNNSFVDPQGLPEIFVRKCDINCGHVLCKAATFFNPVGIRVLLEEIHTVFS